ncbi:Phage XkdN-like tail assembly chaperone protein, TAC [Cohnella sp. OV330]|uniref:phage tail assembly chaperone n=1 Tax=Cohnella sp. OV330 TaxID=1855288 RepID=UPI0008EF1012|nr:hypothetical protein [Cohnella sp. OV330]SFB62581.1 Phage XkdN-like tail assembly chaperone protein, TAC [Cohnella sp. OV330]
MTQPLTIEQLLERKETLKQRKKRSIRLRVDSLNASIVIEEPSRALALEAMEMASDDMKSDLADPHIIYQCVVEPNLKDAELQKAFGCKEPIDIVGMIFLPGEIGAIAGHALQLAGYGSGVSKIEDKINDDLKN